VRNVKFCLLLGFLFAAVTACSSNPAQPAKPQEQSSALKTQMTKLDLELGPQVDQIVNLSIDTWKYMNDKNFTVTGGDSQTYLVTLQAKCYGLSLPTSSLIMATSKDNQLTKHDTILVKNKGMTINHCKVEEMHEVKPM